MLVMSNKLVINHPMQKSQHKMASQLNFTKISPGVTSTNSSQINGQSFGPALPKFNSK